MATMKEITRTQTGVRLESRLLKVLKALATELDLSLGDLLEGIVLHAFEGKAPFSAATLRKIKALQGGVRPRPQRPRLPPAARGRR